MGFVAYQGSTVCGGGSFSITALATSTTTRTSVGIMIISVFIYVFYTWTSHGPQLLGSCLDGWSKDNYNRRISKYRTRAFIFVRPRCRARVSLAPTPRHGLHTWYVGAEAHHFSTSTA